MFTRWLNPDHQPHATQHSCDAEIYVDLEDLAALSIQAKMLRLPSARRIIRQQAGLHHSPFKGRGMEFAEVRHYQNGDDVRSIDWKVTARKLTPHTKLFHEEREQPVYVLCDQSSSLFFGSQLAFKSVRAAQMASLVAWHVLSKGDRIGGAIFTDEAHYNYKPARSRKRVMAYLSALAKANQSLSIEKGMSGQFTINEALTESRRYIHPGSLTFVISDFQKLSMEGKRHLQLIAKHSEVVIVSLVDPLDAQLPPPGYYPVSNGKDSLLLNTYDKSLLEKYRQAYEAQQEEMKSLCQRIGGRQVSINAALPLSDNLQIMSQLLR